MLYVGSSRPSYGINEHICEIHTPVTDLDDHKTLIVPYRDFVGCLAECDAPCTFQRITEGVLKTIRPAVPQLHGTILTTTDNEREIGVERRKEHVVRVALQGLDAALAQVVPDLDGLVVARSNEVWPVRTGVEFDVVDTLVVRLHSEVWRGRTE